MAGGVSLHTRMVRLIRGPHPRVLLCTRFSSGYTFRHSRTAGTDGRRIRVASLAREENSVKAKHILLSVLLIAPILNGPLAAQGIRPATGVPAGAAAEYHGRIIEAVRILGNRQVPSGQILNVVRTREGARLDLDTVTEDYQRIYDLRRFANVEARIEPTATGVIVVFVVTEQQAIESIAFLGNNKIETRTLQQAIDLAAGQALDTFRIAAARLSIQNLYRQKNFPMAEVDVPADDLRAGRVVFQIAEGPEVIIRKVAFRGNTSFSSDKLKDQIETSSRMWIFRSGTFDPDKVEDDVAALRRFYQQKGFFDARVGRKLIFSPDQTEMQVDFVIEEGPRYIIDRITFKGNVNVSEANLRRDIRLTEGRPFDAETAQRDIRTMVRVYSPLGYVYQPQSASRDYLRIEPRQVFRQEPGKVELVYEINEGRPFLFDRFLIKGNNRTQDKVVLRELRVQPGDLYNSGELQDARDRLLSLPNFEAVSIDPIGDDPDSRAVLIDIKERRTAQLTFGAGINSNGGVAGEVAYEQKNFDLTNWPESWSELWADPPRAFVGAGQNLRISIQPGTEATNASIRFHEPWILDQPYSFTGEAYLRHFVRENWDENHFGGRVSFGKRFNHQWQAGITLRAEAVNISDIEEPPVRAPEILAAEGQSSLTSVGLQVRRDTVRGGGVPFEGSLVRVNAEQYGALGGDYWFQKITVNGTRFFALGEDLLDRKTVLMLRGDAGFILGDAPFFERFYGGGIGNVRGFSFRGISPRSGLALDPVGGRFMVTATAEVSFPIHGESVRGVVFADAGDVESDISLGTIRSSVGAGVRIYLPIFGTAPIAIDFAWPITKDDKDQTQMISFSFGIVR